jgi:hypothetical protein
MAGSVFLRDGENNCDKGRRTVWVTGLMMRTAGLQIRLAAETLQQLLIRRLSTDITKYEANYPVT